MTKMVGARTACARAKSNGIVASQRPAANAQTAIHKGTTWLRVADKAVSCAPRS